MPTNNKLKVKGVGQLTAQPILYLTSGKEIWNQAYGDIGTSTGYIKVSYWDGTELVLGNGDVWSEENQHTIGFYKSITEENNSPNKTIQVISCDVDGNPSGDILHINLAWGEYMSMDISTLTNLVIVYAYGNKFESLTISDLPNLKYLNLSDNNLLTSVNISNLPLLNDLSLYNSQLTSINVSNLPSLTQLGLDNNQITSIDVSNLVNLGGLYLYGNPITNISNVVINTGLLYLNLSNTQITTITSNDLTGLLTLKELDLGENELTSYDFTSLINLEYLGLWSTGIITTDNLPTTLKGLSLDNNGISSLDLSDLTQLENLYLSNNQISDFTQISGLTSNLKRLFLYNNQLTTFDGSDLTGLTHLGIEQNQLTSVNISSLVNLEYAWFNTNQFTSIDLTGLNNLIRLDLSYNQIETIDVSDLVNLSELYLWSNPLTPTSSDFILNTLENTTIKDKGTFNGPISERTSASDEAYDNLINRGWYFDIQAPFDSGPLTFTTGKLPGETLFGYFYSSTNYYKITYWDETFEVLNGSQFIKEIDVNDTSENRTVTVEVCDENGNTTFGNIQEIDLFAKAVTSIDVSNLNNLGYINLPYVLLNSTDTDSIFTNLASKFRNNGNIYMPLVNRTSASDVAYNTLVNDKNWNVNNSPISDLGPLTFVTSKGPGETIQGSVQCFGESRFPSTSSSYPQYKVTFWDGEVQYYYWYSTFSKTISSEDTYETRTVEIIPFLDSWFGPSERLTPHVYGITSIDLENAGVESINLDNLNNLNNFVNLSYSSLNSLDTTKLKNVLSVYLIGSQFSSLDCSNLVNLQYLTLNLNPMTSEGVDLTLNTLASATTKNNGQLWIDLDLRTSASDDAYDTLHNVKSWTINDVAAPDSGPLTFVSNGVEGDTLEGLISSSSGYYKITYWDGTSEVNTNYWYNKSINSSNDVPNKTIEVSVCDSGGNPSFGNITYINLSGYNFDGTKVNSIDLSNLNLLLYLNLTNSPLTTLDLTGKKYIDNLIINNTQISSIDLTDLVVLSTLDCQSTPISTLDLSSNIALEGLYVVGTQLTSLDLTGLDNLIYLNISNTDISSIDLTDKNQLFSLGCSSTQVTSLDLNGLTNLKFVYLDNSPLSSLGQDLVLNSLALSTNVNNGELYGDFTNRTSNSDLAVEVLIGTKNWNIPNIILPPGFTTTTTTTIPPVTTTTTTTVAPTVSFIVVAGEGGGIDGDITYAEFSGLPYGFQANLQAYPFEGYQFDRWERLAFDVVETSTDNPFSYQLVSDVFRDDLGYDVIYRTFNAIFVPTTTTTTTETPTTTTTTTTEYVPTTPFVYLDSASYTGRTELDQNGDIIAIYWDDEQNNYDGILKNGVTYVDYNMTFDGVNDYIDMSLIPDSFWNDGDWTVSSWVKFDNVNRQLYNDNGIVGHGTDTSGQGLQLGERQGKAIHAFWNNDLQGNITLSNDVWYNLVYTYNKTTGQKKIYVNGTLDVMGSGTYTGTGGNTMFGGQPFGGRNLDGQLNSIKLFNSVLSDYEINQIYQNGRIVPTTTTTTTVPPVTTTTTTTP